MTVIFETGYTPGGSDKPLTHARILHRGKMRATGTFSASSTDADYYVDAPGNALTYDRWKPTTLAGNAKWQQDMNTARNVSCCGVAAHTLGSNGCTARIQYSADAVTWTNATSDSAIPDDTPIMFIFTNTSARYWRINITGTDPDIPEIGVCRFGAMMQMEQPILAGHSRMILSRNTQMRSSYSETGEIMGRTRQRGWLTGQAEWSHISDDWIEANWLDFLTNSEAEPFFIAWRPGEYQDVSYVELTQPPSAQFMGLLDLYTVTMQMRGYLDD